MEPRRGQRSGLHDGAGHAAALVDPGKIGFILGRRLGFNFDVFGSVDEALEWLASAPSSPRADAAEPRPGDRGPP